MTFNLIGEPWLPCILSDGATKELSLGEVFAEAPNLAELRDESPLVTAALHRLLLAILHRVHGPESLNAWHALFSVGRFDPDPIRRYLEEHRPAFDLFDRKRPFFQDPSFQQKDPSSTNRLAKELASGNNATLFDHTIESRCSTLGPAAAARLIVAEQAFAVGGGRSDRGYTTSGPLVGGIFLMAIGANLFETLLLNLVVCDNKGPLPPATNDAPSWERPPLDGPKYPRGYLDLLTWPSRSLNLVATDVTGRIQVTGIAYAQGRTFHPAPGFYEPSMAYRRDQKLVHKPIRFSPHKALWRDSAALFRGAETDQVKGAAVLEHLRNLKSNDLLPANRRYQLAALGLCNKKARIDFWRHERFPLPDEYLRDDELVDDLASLLMTTEEVGKAVRVAGWIAAQETLKSGDSEPDRERVAAFFDSLAPDRLYWSRLEVPFRNLLVELPGDDGHRRVKRREWFEKTLYGAARDALRETFGQCDFTPRSQKAFVIGDRSLRVNLGKLRKQLPEAPITQKEATHAD